VVPNGHQLDVSEATRDINGGQKHLSERRAASQRWAERFERGYLEEHGLDQKLQVIEAEAHGRGGASPVPPSGDQGRRSREADGPGRVRSPLSSMWEPDDPLFQNVRGAVERVEASIGKHWDDNSERLSASLYGVALQKGFAPTDELRVAFSSQTPTRQAGELVFLVRAGVNQSPDPFANRAHMATHDALSYSPDVVLRRVSDQQAELGSRQHVAQQSEQFEQQSQAEVMRMRT
jgi:hypothetical protein